MKRKKVIIIGAGKRVQRVIIPALLSVRVLEIDSIFARSRKIVHISGSRNILTQTDIDNSNISEISYIIVSITPDQVPAVLKQLSLLKISHITLLIDTPVLAVRDITHLYLLKNFRKVSVLEDYVSMLPIVAVKKMISQGVIGKINYIYLNHSGFKYHAIALFKLLLQSESISFARRITRSPDCHEIQLISFGKKSTVLEPRDYSVGRMLVVGTKGTIADYPLQAANVISVASLWRRNKYIGINVTKENKKMFGLKAYSYSNNHDITRMENLKVESLIRMFKDLSLNQSQYQYGYIDAVYNTIVSYCLDNFGFFCDVQIPFLRTSMIRGILSIYALRK